ncbi:MAG: cysteine desulfurase [Candidatus Aenigmatarchaeota archaeon]
MSLNVSKVRQDFTILNNGVIYLDNAATALTPKQVVEKEKEYYDEYNANIHRGVHRLTVRASNEYAEAHKKVAKFIDAKPNNVFFTKNTTESLNMLTMLAKKGSKIVVSDVEHHSNFLPWLRLKQKGVVDLDFISVSKDGSIDLAQAEKVCKDADIISITAASNVLGNKMPLKDISKIARQNNSFFIIDGAQFVPHVETSVKELNCDALAFSGHKMLGPTGTGVLWLKSPENVEPLMLGGGTIKDVSLNSYTLGVLPDRFEAGTPNIAGALGLGVAADYLRNVGVNNIEKHEKELMKFILDSLGDKVDLLGSSNIKDKLGVFSFNIKNISHHDVAALLDKKNICVRSGHHCCLPLHKKFNLQGTVRASLYLYNTQEEVEKFIESVRQIAKTFSR